MDADHDSARESATCTPWRKALNSLASTTTWILLAPETVKPPIKNIFAKLAVEKRVQAVSGAQSLGLISTR